MKSEIQIQFGNRVRQLRTNLGISQEKFALQINMDRTYFSSVETGNRNISLMNIQKIAQGLNISISELFDFNSNNN
ncbi:MAG: helix-turn-helix transcriptional regulator [Lachnospiraceae bacterium]|nr:helix-turn-helix transcriptional regulator [Lachnospiraceae bacterium]